MKTDLYEFNAKRVKYSDGVIIDLNKVKPVFIGITNLDGYNVSLITDNAIKKLKENISDTLEVISFKAKDLVEALQIQNYLTVVLFEGEQKEKEVSDGDT